MGEEFRETFTTARDGVQLYARDYRPHGETGKLPVVCLHGLTRNSKDFEDVAPWLASLGRRVIAVDIRGRGKSARSPDPMDYVPRTYVRDVDLQLAGLGIPRAVFLGTSMGGIIAMLMAARHSRKVAAAVLNDVGPEVDPAGIERIKQYAGRDAALESWDDALAYIDRMFGQAFPGMTADFRQTLARRTFRIDQGKPAVDCDPDISIPLARGKAAAPDWVAWLLYRWLARRPVLVLRGEASDILSRHTAEKMVEKGRQASLVTIPGVGHAPFLQEPESRQALETWLRAVP